MVSRRLHRGGCLLFLRSDSPASSCSRPLIQFPVCFVALFHKNAQEIASIWTAQNFFRARTPTMQPISRVAGVRRRRLMRSLRARVAALHFVNGALGASLVRVRERHDALRARCSQWRTALRDWERRQNEQRERCYHAIVERAWHDACMWAWKHACSRLEVEGQLVPEAGGRFSAFVCPVTWTAFSDPVIAADGHSFERAYIEAWFRAGHRTSPLTGCILPHTNLLPNHALRNAIDNWRTYCEERGQTWASAAVQVTKEPLRRPSHEDLATPAAPAAAAEEDVERPIVAPEIQNPDLGNEILDLSVWAVICAMLAFLGVNIYCLAYAFFGPIRLTSPWGY